MAEDRNIIRIVQSFLVNPASKEFNKFYCTLGVCPCGLGFPLVFGPQSGIRKLSLIGAKEVSRQQCLRASLLHQYSSSSVRQIHTLFRSVCETDRFSFMVLDFCESQVV